MTLPVWIALLLFVVVHSALAKSLFPHLQCRDPGVGHDNDQVGDRKFLILSGRGGGIGNYLVFYPAAYYFAALTGRVSTAIVRSFTVDRFAHLCLSFRSSRTSSL